MSLAAINLVTIVCTLTILIYETLELQLALFPDAERDVGSALHATHALLIQRRQAQSLAASRAATRNADFVIVRFSIKYVYILSTENSRRIFFDELFVFADRGLVAACCPPDATTLATCLYLAHFCGRGKS